MVQMIGMVINTIGITNHTSSKEILVIEEDIQRR